MNDSNITGNSFAASGRTSSKEFIQRSGMKQSSFQRPRGNSNINPRDDADNGSAADFYDQDKSFNNNFENTS